MQISYWVFSSKKQNLYFLVGILGIYLSSYNLWMNLLLFQGFSLFLVGLFKKN